MLMCRNRLPTPAVSNRTDVEKNVEAVKVKRITLTRTRPNSEILRLCVVFKCFLLNQDFTTFRSLLKTSLSTVHEMVF